MDSLIPTTFPHSMPNPSTSSPTNNAVNQVSNNPSTTTTTTTRTTNSSLNTKKSNAQDPNQSSKGLEYKNLIKEKILKPSKSPEYQYLKKHHSHLVIRDSNYFNKNPSSFIACASCHRGRVLKLSLIKESTTNDILNEIYSIIGVNPCSKKRAKQSSVSSSSSTSVPTVALSSSIDQRKQRPAPISSSSSSNTTVKNHSTNSISTSVNSNSSFRIPNFEDFFADIDQPSTISNINLKVPIKSINSFTTITSASLISILTGETNFPTSLDLFLSLGISQNFPEFHDSKDTLIIPLPCISNTRFSNSLDENIYLNDFNLNDSINHKISNFLSQKNSSSSTLSNLKIIVIICSFQEGSPQNPQEDQTHKYVGKLLILSDFIVNELNNQLLYQTRKFFLNHDYTYIDSKFEWLQSQFLQKIIIKPLQSHFAKKFDYPVLGDQISSDVFLNTSISLNVPYIMNSGFYQINHTTSLYIVCYLVLNLLGKFVQLGSGLDDQMGLMGALNGIEYNNQFNIHVLKLVLDELKNL